MKWALLAYWTMEAVDGYQHASVMWQELAFVIDSVPNFYGQSCWA